MTEAQQLKRGKHGYEGEDACKLTLIGENGHHSTPFPPEAR